MNIIYFTLRNSVNIRLGYGTVTIVSVSSEYGKEIDLGTRLIDVTHDSLVQYFIFSWDQFLQSSWPREEGKRKLELLKYLQLFIKLLKVNNFVKKYID